MTMPPVPWSRALWPCWLPAETGEQGGLMLFKGSRGNHLEELLEALEQSDWLPGSRTESL